MRRGKHYARCAFLRFSMNVIIALILFVLMMSSFMHPVRADDFSLSNVIVEVKVPPYEKPKQYNWFILDINIKNLNKCPIHVGNIELILDNGKETRKFLVDTLKDKYVPANDTTYIKQKIFVSLSGKTKIIVRVEIYGYAMKYKITENGIYVEDEKSLGIQYAVGMTQVNIQPTGIVGLLKSPIVYMSVDTFFLWFLFLLVISLVISRKIKPTILVITYLVSFIPIILHISPDAILALSIIGLPMLLLLYMASES